MTLVWQVNEAWMAWCRFEQLALEYDSDELGELDDVGGGGAELQQYGAILQKSMAEQVTSVPLVKGLCPDSSVDSARKDRGDDDARIAVRKVRKPRTF